MGFYFEFVVLNAVEIIKGIAVIAINGGNDAGEHIGHIGTGLSFIVMTGFARAYFHFQPFFHQVIVDGSARDFAKLRQAFIVLQKIATRLG